MKYYSELILVVSFYAAIILSEGQPRFRRAFAHGNGSVSIHRSCLQISPRLSFFPTSLFYYMMSESDLDTLDDHSDFKDFLQQIFGTVSVLSLHRQRTKAVTEQAILQLASTRTPGSAPVIIIKIAVLCSYNCVQQV